MATSKVVSSSRELTLHNQQQAKDSPRKLAPRKPLPRWFHTKANHSAKGKAPTEKAKHWGQLPIFVLVERSGGLEEPFLKASTRMLPTLARRQVYHGASAFFCLLLVEASACCFGRREPKINWSLSTAGLTVTEGENTVSSRFQVPQRLVQRRRRGEDGTRGSGVLVWWGPSKEEACVCRQPSKAKKRKRHSHSFNKKDYPIKTYNMTDSTCPESHWSVKTTSKKVRRVISVTT